MRIKSLHLDATITMSKKELVKRDLGVAFRMTIALIVAYTAITMMLHIKGTWMLFTNGSVVDSIQINQSMDLKK